MDLIPILVAAGILGAIGAASAALLGLAARFFLIEVDPRAVALQEALPGANCGGCGFAGCAGYAAAMAAGKAAPTLCAPGGAETAARLGAVLGVAVAAKARVVARLRCNGGSERAFARVGYSGLPNCKAVTLLAPGGTKKCAHACEGLGDCVAACAFGAIVIGPEQLPVVDEQKCTGCGKCVAACPKKVLDLHPDTEKLSVRCGNQVPTKQVRQICEVGCVHCKACVRACQYGALAWEHDLPKRLDGKCVSCGLCVEACRPKVMHFAAGFEPHPLVRQEALRLTAERKAQEAAKKQAAHEAAQAAEAAANARPQPGPAPAFAPEGKHR